MTGSAKQSTARLNDSGLLRRCAPRKDDGGQIGYGTDLPDRLFGGSSVQPALQKFSGSRLTQITSITLAVLPHSRGVSRSSRTRGGMRWTRQRRAREVVAGRVFP